MQAKQETRDDRKKTTEKSSETYDERAYEDVEEWEDQEDEEEEETDLDNLVKLKGKLKSSGPSAQQINMPLYAPPFAPANTRPTYGYAPNYGPPFHPSAYPQYPGFPYVGVPGAAGPFPVTPTYPYPPGLPHWGMDPGTTPSPGSNPYLPGCNMVAQQPQQLPVQPPAPAPVPSVFSRIGVKSDTSLLAATLQQPAVSSAPTPINDVESASEALRRAAAGYPASSTAPAPHAYQINLPVQTSPEKVVDTTLVPAIQLATRSLLANIPEPQFSAVTSPDKSLKSGRDRKASSCSDGSYAQEEEIDNYPDFKPIIPLPEEVEVKTGEEGEDVLFDQRGKLFRFVDSEWKERGVGQLKLLQDPTTKKIRLIMRRDQVKTFVWLKNFSLVIRLSVCLHQVLKICANHYITSDIKLTEMSNSKNSWIWAAMDFADGEGKLEKFAARFKTLEISIEFQQAFEKAKKTDVVKSKPEIQTTNKKESEVKGFGDKFVPKSGTWNCSVCYVNNSAGVIKCVACETLKPGEVAAPSTTPAIQMKFGMPPATSTAPATGFKITPSTTTTPASTGFSFSATPTTAANSFAGIKFGVPTSSVAQAVPAFSFSSASTAVTAPVSTPAFGVTPTKSTTATTAGYETPIMPSLVPITASASGFSFGTSKPVSITPLSSQVASLSLPPKRNSYRRPPTPSSPVFLDMPHEFIPSPPFKLTPKTAPQRKSETTAKVSAVGGSGGGQNKEDGEKKGDSGMLFSLLTQKTPSAGFNIAPNKVHLDIVKIIMSVM